MPDDPNLFIQPLDLSQFAASDSNTNPGFTQLVTDTLGSGGSSADGFDQLVADTAAGLDVLDQVLGEQDAALDELLALAGATDPGQLDNSLAGYASTFDAGNALVSAGNALTPPELLVLPLAPTPYGGIPGPASQITQDFGTMHLGDDPVSFLIGVATVSDNQYLGVSNVMVANGNRYVFQVLSDEQDTRQGDQIFTYRLWVTPAVLGESMAQVEWNHFSSADLTILTVKVNVIP